MSAAKAKKRLRPGELDGLVLTYMAKHKDDSPLTASAIGTGIERSSGAVANCLARQPESEGPRQMISAAEVSARWGVARRWVYNHATELGACRLGSGSRPRLRFDPIEVAERLGAPRREPVRADGRRLTAIGARRHSDSLSAPTRAMFDGQRKR